VPTFRDPYVNSVVLSATTGQVKINLTNNRFVWVIEQINAFYSKTSDSPQCSVIRNGIVYSGPAPMSPSINGLGQTFAGLPYLYMQNRDDVEVFISGGSAGGLLTVQAQFREIETDDPELRGRF
jgi:hypothetical protein